MSEYKHIQNSVYDEIQTITINNPGKLNAINELGLAELKRVIEKVYDDDRIKGIIITGIGEKSFVSGFDIKELVGINEVNARKFSEQGQEVLQLIENCSKPVIALVNGYAIGSGFDLALACHLRIATQNAIFRFPEASLGLIPGYGGTQRLTYIVGKGRALEMMMTCDPIPANIALDYGLVNHVLTDKKTAFEKCIEILKKIFKNAPLSIGNIIDCVNAVYSPEENGFLIEANSFASSCKSSDFKEGIKAFLDKRSPVFKGQ